MSRSQEIVAVAMVSISALAAAGCGDRFAPVEGLVTLNGQPFEAATIAFLPEERGGGKNAPRQANGLSRKDGRYSLETVNDKGVIPGTYRVTVSKKVYPSGFKPPPTANTIDWQMQSAAKMVESVPAKYTNAKDTPLKVVVPRGGMKNADLVLEGSAPLSEKATPPNLEDEKPPPGDK